MSVVSVRWSLTLNVCCCDRETAGPDTRWSDTSAELQLQRQRQRRCGDGRRPPTEDNPRLRSFDDVLRRWRRVYRLVVIIVVVVWIDVSVEAATATSWATHISRSLSSFCFRRLSVADRHETGGVGATRRIFSATRRVFATCFDDCVSEWWFLFMLGVYHNDVWWCAGCGCWLLAYIVKNVGNKTEFWSEIASDINRPAIVEKSTA